MGVSHESGPSVIYGPVSAVNPNINPIYGPSATYQGDCILDPRAGYRPGTDSRVGTVKGWLDTPYILLVDTVPPTLQTAGISVLAPAASGTAQTLVACLTVQTATILVAGTGYDNGPQVFTVNSGTASSKATVSIFVTGGIPTGAVTILTGGNYSVTPTLAGTATTGPTGSGLTLTLTVGTVSIFDSTNTLRTGLFAIDTPYIPQVCGVMAAFNPKATLTRNVTVTGSASATGGNITIAGYDLYGVAMSEVIAAPASATTVQGKKAFKYVASATPAFTDAGHNYSVGWGDIVGVNLRNNAWEFTNFYWNGAFITVSTGWLASVGTTATTTTGDVRGTYALQSASDGTKRLAMFLSLQLYDLTNANPVDYSTLFGTLQA